MKSSLFEIGEDLKALEDLIESLDGDISDPKADEAITAWFNEFSSNQSVKVDSYINLIRKWENEKAAATAEAERYQKTSKVRDGRIVRLKFRLKEYMESTRQLKIETATGRKVAINNNGGEVPIFIDASVDPSKLDARFQKISIELNKEAVRTALQAGEVLTFARIAQRGTHLKIS